MAGREEGGGRRVRGGRRREEPARPSGASVRRGRVGLVRARRRLAEGGVEDGDGRSCRGRRRAGGGELEVGMGANVLWRPAAVDGKRIAEDGDEGARETAK